MPPSTAPTSSRSARAHAAVLRAAWGLFAECGLRGLTVESIAERSGVAKTTIYRQWPSKNAVVLDALHEHLDTTIAFPGTGSVRQDLARQIKAVIRLLKTDAGRVYLALIAESQHDHALAKTLHARYIAHRRQAATEVIERGIKRGQLPAGTDPSLLIDMLYGAIYYRFMISHQPPSARFADQVLDLVLGPRRLS